MRQVVARAIGNLGAALSKLQDAKRKIPYGVKIIIEAPR